MYLIYFSPSGGTLKVANRVSSRWENVKPIDLSVPDTDFSQYTFSEKDCCMICFPVYEGRVPPIVINRLSQMKAKGTPCIPVAVYGNRNINDALLEATDILKTLGFETVACGSAVAQHSMFWSVAPGRPDNIDIEELKKFSVQLKTAVESGNRVKEIPGKRPYIVIHLPPHYPLFNKDKCVNCMLCAEKCPVKAISFEDVSMLNTSVCVSCSRCAKICPTGARFNDPERETEFLKLRGHVFEGRKPNEIFL